MCSHLDEYFEILLDILKKIVVTYKFSLSLAKYNCCWFEFAFSFVTAMSYSLI